MYNWIHNHTRLEYCTEEEPFDFSFARGADFTGRMEPQPQPAEMTALAQYFIAAGVWLSDDCYLSLPMRNEEAGKRVLEEVTPHFAEVRQYGSDGVVTELVLKQLKPASRALFLATSTDVLPVMQDLYRHHDTGGWENAVKRTVVYFTVNAAGLVPYEGEEMKELQTVLRKLYFEPAGNEFALTPLGWQLDDSLKHSRALRFLAGFVPYLTLAVNAGNGEVISIHLSRQEYTRQILLSEGRPKPPRRNGNFLYLDLSRKLVYVVDLSKQGKLESWNDLNGEAKVYHAASDGDFAQFDHLTAEPIPGGVGLFYDTDTIRSMIEAINLELESF